MSLQAIRRTAVALAVLTFVLMVLGSWVKATGSGLACPDWPACYGDWLPPFPSAETGGVDPDAFDHADAYTQAQVLYEWGHRALAMVVGVATLALAIQAFLHRHALNPWLWRLSVASLFFVIVQGGLGGATVLLGNTAAATTVHLANALVTFACILGALAVAVLAPHPPAPRLFPGESAPGVWSHPDAAETDAPASQTRTAPGAREDADA